MLPESVHVKCPEKVRFPGRGRAGSWAGVQAGLTEKRKKVLLGVHRPELMYGDGPPSMEPLKSLNCALQMGACCPLVSNTPW